VKTKLPLISNILQVISPSFSLSCFDGCGTGEDPHVVDPCRQDDLLVERLRAAGREPIERRLQDLVISIVVEEDGQAVECKGVAGREQVHRGGGLETH